MSILHSHYHYHSTLLIWKTDWLLIWNGPPLELSETGLELECESESYKYVTTDGQSECLSWNKALIWSLRPEIFITLWQLRFSFCGAPSLTRGRVCLLYMLVVLASRVLLGSESLWYRDHILQSHIWDLPLRRLLRLAGPQWRYSTPTHWTPNYTRVAIYSLRADCTENSPSIVGKCLPNHCKATVAALTA
jgi:hypothetical protein